MSDLVEGDGDDGFVVDGFEVLDVLLREVRAIVVLPLACSHRLGVSLEGFAVHALSSSVTCRIDDGEV